MDGFLVSLSHQHMGTLETRQTQIEGTSYPPALREYRRNLQFWKETSQGCKRDVITKNNGLQLLVDRFPPLRLVKCADFLPSEIVPKRPKTRSGLYKDPTQRFS